MPRSTRIIRYLAVALLLLTLASLVWWYFFLRARTASIAEGDARRGIGESAQTFGGPAGSTYENIVSSFASPITRATGETRALRLLQISKTPTAGMGFVVGTSTRLRFVERSTGYVLEANGETGALTRLTNTTLPVVYEALVSNGGGLILERISDDGVTVTSWGKIASSALRETRLPDGIRAITLSPNGDAVFYIVSGPDGAVGIRSSNNQTKEEKPFSSAIAGWSIQWLSDGRIVLVQNPSDGVPGYAYEIGASGALAPLLRERPGLTVLPRANSPTLMWGESDGRLRLYGKTSATSSASLLPIRTTADKCVWAPGAALVAYCAVPAQPPPSDYLDQRARGEVHTADQWWRVDVRANSAELLFSPGNAELDVEKPAIDNAGAYIAFINGKDKTLWRLRVSEE